MRGRSSGHTEKEKRVIRDQVYDATIRNKNNWKFVKAQADFKRPIYGGYFDKREGENENGK